MNDRRRGLGRGLGALLPTVPAGDSAGALGLAAAASPSSPVDVLIPERTATEQGSESTATVQGLESTAAAHESESTAAERGLALRDDTAAFFAELPVRSIRPNPRQPRHVFDEDAMTELVDSIRAVGLLQPVVVRAAGNDEYELVMGERRWRAAQLADLREIPAIVRATADGHLLRDALLENLHRSALNPLEEAAAYDQLLADFGSTHEELAARLGRSRPQITNTLRLLKLPPPVQRRVAAGILSAGHARALLSLPEPTAQEQLAARIVAEGLSVRSVEEIVARGGDVASPAPRRVPLAKPRAPRLDDISARLSDRFETRVKVDLGRRKGKITVEFASLDDLQRILAMLEPAEAADFSTFPHGGAEDSTLDPAGGAIRDDRGNAGNSGSPGNPDDGGNAGNADDGGSADGTDGFGDRGRGGYVPAAPARQPAELLAPAVPSVEPPTHQHAPVGTGSL